MKNKNLGLLLVAGFLVFSFSAPSSFGRSGSGGSGEELGHYVSVGFGIANPSLNSSLLENPAGLTYNSHFELLAQGATANTNLSPLSFGGMALFGNGTVGAGVALDTGTGNNSMNLRFGLGAYILPLNTAFGVTAGTDLNTAVGGAGSLSSNSINAGLIFNPYQMFRIGVTVYDIQNAPDAYGAGLALDVGNNATLVADATVNSNLKALTISPGLNVHLFEFQASASYGIQVDNTATSYQRTGFTAAVGFHLGRQIHLQFAYNEFSNYFLGLGFTIN